jgi:ABC-type arginine transport system permease subunit
LHNSDVDEIVKRKLQELAVSVPKYSVLLTSVHAAVPTLFTVLMFNLKPKLAQDALIVFAVLYVITLPVVVVGLNILYRLTKRAHSVCREEGDTRLREVQLAPFVLGVLPLGYLYALYYAIVLLSRCKPLRSVYRPGILFIDAIVNVFTFGLIIIVYGINLERLLNYLSRGSETLE